MTERELDIKIELVENDDCLTNDEKDRIIRGLIEEYNDNK